jgi:hypothetical protein
VSGPDARLEARDQFDPIGVAKKARAELDRQQTLVESIKRTIEKGYEAIRRSQQLIARIPDKW